MPGMKKLIAVLREFGRGSLNGTRYPYRQRSAWIVIVAWSLAFLSAGYSTVLALIVGPDWGLAINIPVAILDIVMLRLAVKGLLYRRKMDAYIRGMVYGE